MNFTEAKQQALQVSAQAPLHVFYGSQFSVLMGFLHV